MERVRESCQEPPGADRSQQESIEFRRSEPSQLSIDMVDFLQRYTTFYTFHESF